MNRSDKLKRWIEIDQNKLDNIAVISGLLPLGFIIAVPLKYLYRYVQKSIMNEFKKRLSCIEWRYFLILI